ncbi:uncharacterized protein LOC109520470 [Hippocampus comes]|uniref:uncharacterized protein LOC109520470 n=1 Tax=Hippocampus comes TaxID=109280 RepID=UPI00094E7993|nr:PREDICTED: uncharacterized protein LOC109520470 [Hippocampus comes]
MACRERGGSKILLYVGLFLLASGTFCQCSRLAVKSRRNAPPIPSKRDVSYSGRLLISQQVAPPNKASSHILDADSDYQGDMGWDFYKQASMQDEHFSKAVTHQLIKMDPKVECTTDSMKLQVQDVASTPGSLIWVDRGSLAPLPLSKLPQSCGYTIGETQNEMFLVTPYDGCFVTLEGDSYVLPLLWWGLPMRMSCPVTRPSSSPPMVTCHTEGMIVKTEWRVPLSRIKINVNGKWELINSVLHKCGIGVVDHGEGVVLSVNYGACVEKKDGMYTFELAGEGTTKISCPSMAPGLSEPTTSPTPTKLEPPNIGLIPSHSFYYPPSSHSKPVVPPNLRPVGNPLQPESPYGHGEQPVNPLVPVRPENEPKPSPQFSQQQTPDTQSYLFPYPLNPTPDPVQKPPAAPHETEVPSVEKPTDPYPYPRYHMPSPNEPTNKQMPNPQIHEVTPGPILKNQPKLKCQIHGRSNHQTLESPMNK